MKYLYLIFIIGFSSCLFDNKPSDIGDVTYTWDTTVLTDEQKVIDTSENYIINVRQSTGKCEANTLFKENLTLPLEINYDFFTMFDNIGEKVAIPYECINGGEMDLHNGEPINIYYAYGKAKLDNKKDYYLLIETVNPENPVDLFYTSAILFSNNNGALENEIEIGKYHAYSGVKEYYDAQLNSNGTINQHIKKIGNDGITESVFEERDTSFSIIN